MNPPRILVVLGIIFIAFGALSIVEMISNLTRDKFQLNIGFVFIPIGYGLLIGRQSSLG